MLENQFCRKISFTGSTRVGKILIQGASSTCTRLSLELGGNAPVIIFDDADLDVALESAILIKFRNTGQSCVSANRIYVQRTIYDRFIEAFSERSKRLRIGNGLEEFVDIGPLISREALKTALLFIDDAVGHGARLINGGVRWGGIGNFLEPTILADVPENALCAKDEIFAPVAAFFHSTRKRKLLTGPTIQNMVLRLTSSPVILTDQFDCQKDWKPAPSVSMILFPLQAIARSEA